MFDGETALLTLIYCLFYLFVLVDILSFFFWRESSVTD